MTRIAFIGLGIMGRPMASRLVAAGHDLTVHNRSRAAVAALQQLGAASADDPAGAAAEAEVVITMLPDSPDVQRVMTGADGVLASARPGTLVIDMSTISPVVARELAAAASERGVGMLDAPVSGGDVGAREGTLSIMVGGPEDQFERARPIFECLGSSALRVGDVGAGQVVKTCNQVVVALTIEAVSEALVLGSKAGVKPELILDALGGGLAGNQVMKVRRSHFLTHRFDPGFKVTLHSKDLDIALATAKEYAVPLPATGLVSQMLGALRACGRGDQDHTALLTVLEDLAAHQIAGPPTMPSPPAPR